MGSGWLQQHREFAFKSSERTAIITDAPNVYAIFSDDEIAPYLGDFQNGTVQAGPALRIYEEIARSMMVRPRIARIDEDLPEYGADEDDPAVIPYSALYTTEVDELVEIWSEAAEKAARFRDEREGAGDGGGGKGVGAKSKRGAGAAKRKSASSDD